jgi:hypothetical protein
MCQSSLGQTMLIFSHLPFMEECQRASSDTTSFRIGVAVEDELSFFQSFRTLIIALTKPLRRSNQPTSP